MKMINPLLFATLSALCLGVPQVNAQTAMSAESKAATDKEEDQFYGAMQERYRLMQEQMQKIRQTKDPAERRRLIQEHWVTMHEGAVAGNTSLAALQTAQPRFVSRTYRALGL